MKWLSLLFPLLLKQLNPAIETLSQSSLQLREEMSLKSRKIALIILAGIATTILFAGGLLLSLMEAARQLDNSNALQVNAVIATGFSLCVASLLAAVLAFRSWPGVRARKQRLKQERAQLRAQREQLGQAVSLDQAVAMLILDFVKEREQKRTASSPLAQES